MRCLRFAGRYPRPKSLVIGMEGEHNAETIKISGLPDFDAEQTAILYAVMPDDESIDMLTITDNMVTITRNQTPTPGTLTGWVVIQVGTDIVWKSDTFEMTVEDLPDAAEMIEQQYPSALDNVVAQTHESELQAEAWANGTRAGVPIQDDNAAYGIYSKAWSQESEAWAVGQRGGVDVGESDSTYRNNAKHYADCAEQAADSSGYLEIWISDSGHLIYRRTSAVEFDFEIDENGHLILDLI